MQSVHFVLKVIVEVVIGGIVPCHGVHAIDESSLEPRPAGGRGLMLIIENILFATLRNADPSQ